MKTEGRNAVIELLKTGKTIDKIMLEKGAQGSLGLIFAQARKKGVRVQFVDRQVLDKESATNKLGCAFFYIHLLDTFSRFITSSTTPS